ncbi:MAG TPA: ABC transporter permease [Terriglobia bacterium]|nr:ABC transporter permease [Terriglobia bacterium]
MQRIWAIIERDLRKFQHSPFLMFASLVFPVVQFVVLGYAFGGNLKNLKVGVVDQDHGMAAVKLREMAGAVEANAKTFQTVNYSDLTRAVTDLRNAKLSAVVNIPPHFTRDVLAQANPQVGLIVDNTDNFVASTLESSFGNLVSDYYSNGVDARMQPALALQTVEIYGYTPYIKFLLPGVIALAIFIMAMIGGGIIFIDDKARGLHEGYLVTPISKIELILGFILSGAFKGVLAGLVLTVFGSLIAGVQHPLDPLRLAKMTLLIIPASVAFISMMFLVMVRVSDPLTPRAIMGVLNTLLYFPSGAVYPVNAFPSWMRVIATLDPLTYAVHGFRMLLLKNTGFGAIAPDIVFLSVFSVIMLVSATALFQRTL